MNVMRVVILGVLGLVFFAAVLSSNVLLAADQTVMDAEYAADTAEEAELHEEITAELRAELEGQVDVDQTEYPIEISSEELVSDAISSEHVQSEIEANLERLYAYLHGEADELRLEVDATPVKTGIVESVDDNIDELELADVADQFEGLAPEDLEMDPAVVVPEMAENESQFLHHRERFEEQMKDRIQEESPYPMTDEQAEQAYEQRRDEIRSEMHDKLNQQIDQAVEEGAIEPAFEPPVRTIGTAWVDAMTGAVEYQEYTAQIDGAMESVRTAAVEELETRLDEELPDTIDLTEEIGEEQVRSMETAQTATTTADTLTLVLPILGLVTAGVVAYLFPTSTAAIVVGLLSALVGGVGLVAASVGGSTVADTIASADGPEPVLRFVELLLDGLFGLLTWQSGALLVIGLGLMGLGVAIRRDLLDAGLE
ncbi:hypothetical protein [Halovivax limisalsi]|uniref:hypothetical protein n=1 Tax=Halovivax limisalsi TaxID=1453760 RepID=UPI001FFC7F3D|nr:hypothetical protein [Halovivax limisalsi]